jgi:hypothetical protein
MSRGSSLNLLYCQQLIEERFDCRLQEAERARMVRVVDTHHHEGGSPLIARLRALLMAVRRATWSRGTLPSVR